MKMWDKISDFLTPMAYPSQTTLCKQAHTVTHNYSVYIPEVKMAPSASKYRVSNIVSYFHDKDSSAVLLNQT